MRFSINLSFVLILALAMRSASSVKDFKTEFGERFGETLKAEGIELFQSAIKALDEFYDTIIAQTSSSPEEVVKVKHLKNDILELSKNIGNMDSKQLVKEIEAFVTNKYSKMTNFIENANKANDAKKVELITKSMELTGVKLKDAGKKFTIDICTKWEDMYKTIPKEELEKFPQYGRINELMSDLKKIPGNGAATFDVVKAIINFFEYDDWKFLLQIETQTKL